MLCSKEVLYEAPATAECLREGVFMDEAEQCIYCFKYVIDEKTVAVTKRRKVVGYIYSETVLLHTGGENSDTC